MDTTYLGLLPVDQVVIVNAHMATMLDIPGIVMTNEYSPPIDVIQYRHGTAIVKATVHNCRTAFAWHGTTKGVQSETRVSVERIPLPPSKG
mgnify:CR=1 FL=1